MQNYLVRKNGNFLDEAFDSFFKPVYWDTAISMKTDIKEFDDKYELGIELPGYNKEDIAIDFTDGYINITAKKEEEEEDKKTNYIFRERKVSASRAYYIGEVNEEDIKAKYDNGILTVTIPKETEKKEKNSKILID